MKDDKGGFLSEYLVKNSSGEQRWVEGLGTKIDFMERSAVILTLRDVTDRKFAREALIQVNKNNNKMNLLNSITRHDLLNQLSVLQGCLELAMNHETNPVTREYLNRGNNACETIRRQIDFSRDYQNIGVLSPQWQNVHEVIGHAAESCDLGTVTLVINSNDVSVYADPLLEKVFYNIIDNSLKHAGAFTEIRFFTEDVNNGLRIVYTDDGIGILDAEKELVFKHRFGRHTGYGLYLAREILSITGLSLKETGISGEGARFEIFVPHGLYRHRDEGEKAPGTYSPEKSDNTPETHSPEKSDNTPGTQET
jgi:signal transduction histidine kinase